MSQEVEGPEAYATNMEGLISLSSRCAQKVQLSVVVTHYRVVLEVEPLTLLGRVAL